MTSPHHTQRFLWATAHNACLAAALSFLLGALLLAFASVFQQGLVVYYAGVFGLALTAMLAFSGLLLKHQVDYFSLGCFLLFAVVSLHYIHTSDDGSYTSDLPGHATRIVYMTTHWLDPFSYTGEGVWGHSQKHHPPVYYYLAAAVYKAYSTAFNYYPWTSVRFLSWIFYLAFNAYNLLTLRRFGAKGPACRAACALLMLWPLGFHFASKISPEPMYYAFYAIAFYYMVVWHQTKEQRPFLLALIFSGVDFMVRTNAFFLFVMIGLLLLWNVARGDFRLQRDYLKHYVTTGTFLLVCGLVNIAALLLGKMQFSYYMGAYEKLMVYPAHFLTFNPFYFILRPDNQWQPEQTYLEFLMRTSIIAEYAWPWPIYTSILQALLVALFLYTLVGAYIAGAGLWRDKGAILAIGIIVPLLFQISFSMHMRHLQAGDARYVFPALVCAAVVYKRVLENYASRGMKRVADAGLFLAYLFAALSVTYFWFNWR